MTSAERESRWQLLLRFAIEAASENEAAAVLGQALAQLGKELQLRSKPAIHPRHRGTPDGIWLADLEPDLTRFRALEPDDAKTRCRIVQGPFPIGVHWSLPQNTEDEAKAEWPPDIWQRQSGRDDELLHPAIQGVMIYCKAKEAAEV
jgi:hypothetical protein